MATAVLPEVAAPADGLADLGGIGLGRTLRLGLRAAPVLRTGWTASIVLALLGGTGRIVAPLTVQRALDDHLDHVGLAVAVGAVAVLVAGVASYLLNRRLQRRVETALAQVRRDGLARVHEMAATTVDRTPAADLTARLTSDLDQVTTFLQGGGIQFVTNTAQLVVATVLMLVYSWLLTIPVLLIAALLLVVMLAVQRVIAVRYDRARREIARMQGVVAESIVGAPVIRATGTDARTVAKLDEAVLRARDSLVRTLPPLHGNTSLGEVAISSMTVAVILLGVWWGTHGHRLTSGQVVAMVFLVTLFVRPLQFLVQSLGEAQNALTGWRRALELALTPSAVVADGVPLPPGPVSLDLTAVSARYAVGPLVLDAVDLHIAAGERVAVVGRTGSGKSTFAKLITRRLEPAGGVIALSGVPLGRLTDASLARRVVIVPQDPFLFGGTIRDNLALGDPEATDDRLVAVLERLGMGSWFRSLHEGLDTPVGVGGARLSMGERQLVALARTALADPDLIVLDEATSGVDPATDVAVQEALAVLTRGRTTISIAHRMITAVEADRVLVFDAGRIVQAGHHLDLVREDGPYAGLFAAWNHR
jgi:ATP-binding cassette, subfamily B, bacterial